MPQQAPSAAAAVAPESAADRAAKASVVAAANSLFYARGIHAVGMDELRTASGIPLKRLYRLFPSKDAIVEAVLLDWRRAWAAGIGAAVDAAEGPGERLLAIYDFLAAWFGSEGFRGCAFINSFGELGAASGRVAEIVREQKAGFQEFVFQLATEAGAPPALGPQLAILAEGAISTAAISGSADPAGQARAAAEILIGAAVPQLAVKSV
jgi:AcrR family transcriptional regulator